MRSLNAWSANHRIISQWLIAFAQIGMVIIAMQLAGRLQSMPVQIPVFVFYGCFVFLLLLSVIASQLKKWRSLSVKSRAGFALVRARYFFFNLAILSAVTWFYYSNQPANSLTQLQGSLPTRVVAGNAASHQKAFKFPGLKTAPVAKPVANAKQLLREFKQLRKGGSSNQGLAIVGMVVAAIALGFLVAVLACSIACNGSGALAIIVGVGGLALIIWGLIKAIRAIKRKQNAAVN